MRATIALIKRELLEHRGAFVYAPAVLVGVLILAIVYSLLSGRADFNETPTNMSSAITIYQIALGGTFGLWSVYAGLGLFFYYADSFSADRRNNALLFWKSMPQSDFKILGSKALAGITIFPALLVGFAVLTAVVLYLGLLLASAKVPFIGAPGPLEALSSLIQMSIVGTIYMFLAILWSAPFLAWVAGLSTLFRRWSIPLALLIPGAVVLLEFLNSLRNGTRDDRPIAEFLAWRLDMIADERALFASLIAPGGGPMKLLTVILESVNWVHMGAGIIVAAAIVSLASEYRRRRIEA